MDDYLMKARRFKALSDVTRMQIVELLAGGELCACKILAHFNITQPTLSYHMKMLMCSGLVRGRREGAWMQYSLNKEAMLEAAAYIKKICSTREKAGAACGCAEGRA